MNAPWLIVARKLGEREWHLMPLRCATKQDAVSTARDYRVAGIDCPDVAALPGEGHVIETAVARMQWVTHEQG